MRNHEDTGPMTDGTLTKPLDVAVVGAGIAGLYLLHRLRAAGFSVTVLEAADDLGGTWYWNRYPGARCDVDSMFYSYSFDDDLQQEWEWTERYATQPEILRYLNHVAERFDLRRDIRFGTRVRAARFDEENGTWTLEAEDGARIHSRFCIMATGCLSAPNAPDFPGLEDFAGDLFRTSNWPHREVDFTGQRVGVVGTGSTGIQLIPVVAEQAAQLIVFQRTPNYVIPAQNRPLDPEEVREIKARYDELRETAKTTPGGFNFIANDVSALSVGEEERNREFEKRWQLGGIPFLGAFNDLALDAAANETAQEFVRAKIRRIVADPETADRLCPDNFFGCKRLCLDTGYFETFNRPNVRLVDVAKNPIERITEAGVQVAGTVHELDALILATGFDAMTGALNRIEIRGRDGAALKEKWCAGPRTYLGLAIAGFPNLFIVTGPGSPSVLSNMMPSIEHHVDWITDCLGYLRDRAAATIEADRGAEDDWVEHVNEVADRTLRVGCDSWYIGANIPGKPRVFMPYIGGVPAYRKKCDEVVAAGYEGFRVT